MTGDELKAAAIQLWGERGWTTALATALMIDRTQVWRYVNSKTPVPGPVQAAVECWLKSKPPETTKEPPPPEGSGG